MMPTPRPKDAVVVASPVNVTLGVLDTLPAAPRYRYACLPLNDPTMTSEKDVPAVATFLSTSPGSNWKPNTSLPPPTPDSIVALRCATQQSVPQVHIASAVAGTI